MPPHPSFPHWSGDPTLVLYQLKISLALKLFYLCTCLCSLCVHMSICLSVCLCVSGLMGIRQRRISSVGPLCIILCCIPLRQSFTEPVARLAASPRQLILVSLPCCPLPHFVLPILPVLLGLQVCMAFLTFYAQWGFESSPHA